MTRRLVEPVGDGTPESEAVEVRDALPTGFRVGPYRLLGVLGSGGMATVYLASLERGSFQKIIALKRIHPHLARDGTMRRMFADEARIASQIAHPNVCQVFDVGEADGVPFLAMEYVQGETVDRIGQALVRLPDLRRNPRFWCFVARIISDAAEGLHAAHEATAPNGAPLEVVHRDIKPSNLIVSYASRTLVMDFGIAHATVRGHVTQTGELKGSLAYMAPEQAAGQTVDRTADIWSLGVVLWELLAGRVLFDRRTAAATFQAVLRGSAPPLTVAAPDVPGPFVEITARALERDPQRRFSTAREFRDAVEAAAEQQGPPLSRDELFAWLSGLFPEGQTQHARLLEKARARGLTFRRGLWLNRKRLVRFGGGVALVVMGVAVGAAGAVRWRTEERAKERTEPQLTDERVLARGTVDTAIAQPPEAIEVGVSPIVLAADGPDVEPTAAEPEPPSALDLAPAGEASEQAPVDETSEAPPGGMNADAPAKAPRRTPRRVRATQNSRRSATMQRAGEARGTLLLVARGGWGRVFLRGRPLGETPLRASLPAGRHRLEVRFASGERRPVAVRIRPGRATRVSIDAR